MNELAITMFCFLVLFGSPLHSQEDPCNPPKRVYQSPEISPETVTADEENNRSYHSDRQFQFSPEINTSKYSGLKVNIDSDIHEKLSWRFKPFELMLFFKDRSSFSYYTDSLLEWNIDQLSFGIEATAISSFAFKPSLALSIESEKFKKYLQDRKLSSAFLSPGIIRLGSGFNYSINDNNELHLGLASAKITWIRLKSLYDILDQEEIMGVSRDVPYLFEGGLSMRSNLKAQFNRVVSWEQTCSLFYSIALKKYAEMEMLNKICIKLNDGFETSLQSRFVYNENYWPHSNWQTQLSIAYELPD